MKRKIILQLKKEFSPLLLFIAAVLIFGTLSIFGMVYNLGKSLYKASVKSFIVYWLNVAYQFWNVVKYYLMESAIACDLFANVAAGEMLEDIVTARENTLYGKGYSTLSAATGLEEIDKELNPRGLWLTNSLSNVLGKNHSIQAYLSLKAELGI